MSARRLRVLIQRLPPESATWTALRNAMPPEELDEQAEKGEPEKGRWSQSEQLIAQLADRVAELTYLYTLSHTDKGKPKPKRPTPIRRPGVTPAKPQQRMSEAQASHLFEMLKERAA